MKINRKLISNIMIAVGGLVILTAAGMAIYNEYENYKSADDSNRIVEELKETPAVDDGDSALEELYAMPIVEIDGYGYIGYLSFPSLDVEFPVMAEWDYDRLKIAPCRYYGALKTHDLVIAGHNYRDGFGKMKKLQEGDTVYFTAMDGVRYEYVVDLTEVLEPTDIEEMIVSPWDLSLYTCTYGGELRMTVRCNEVE